jgi:AraC family transcriptional activator of pobA
MKRQKLVLFFDHHPIAAHALPAARPPSAIPQFALYGELTRATDAEFVHIELIETRSRATTGISASHTHAGLFQVLFLFGGEVAATAGVNRAVGLRGPVALTIHPSLAHGFDFSEEARAMC